MILPPPEPVTTAPAFAPLVLVGFMGVGKTTIARLLAKRLQKQWIDTDTEIEARLGMSISQLFATRGEAFFREQEQIVLTDHLTNGTQIIALGGGAWIQTKIRDLLRNTSAQVIYLHAEVATLQHRILREPGKRPLLDGLPEGNQLRERIRSLLSLRESLYREADRTVSTDLKNPEEIVADILNDLDIE